MPHGGFALDQSATDLGRDRPLGNGRRGRGFQARCLLPGAASCAWCTLAPAFNGSVPPKDAASIVLVQTAAQLAWQHQVLATLGCIWRWRHNVRDGAQQWSREVALAYHLGTLAAAMRSLAERSPPPAGTADPCGRVHMDLADRFLAALRAADPPPAAPPEATPTRVLFFDGGSRGNPGPGGAGTVIIEVDDDAVSARVVWSASMSHAASGMTNNQAEYHGVIAGLTEALARSWPVEVVGDSLLFLRQLRQYCRPKCARLLPLYAQARRLANKVGVTVCATISAHITRWQTARLTPPWTRATACSVAIPLRSGATQRASIATVPATSMNGERAIGSAH